MYLEIVHNTGIWYDLKRCGYFLVALIAHYKKCYFYHLNITKKVAYLLDVNEYRGRKFLS